MRRRLALSETAWEGLVLAVALAGAALVTRDHAGSWNDGSRFAAAESLVERGTWAIDDSVFVRPPAGGPSPYPPDDLLLTGYGTLDKLFIDGHWYTDKPPVSVLPLAAVYAVWHGATGETARSRPDLFCRTLTFATSGLAFAVAAWSLVRLGRYLGLARPWRLALAASLTFGGAAWAYAGYANAHVLLLATASLLFAEMVRLARRPEAPSAGRVLLLGGLAGVSYGLDLGAGPPLLAATGLWALWRLPRRSVALFAAAALPWLALHHGLNYAVAGTWKPANMVREHLAWPDSPFTEQTMTGRWQHADAGDLALYALDLLFGQKGFLLHTPPLLLSAGGLVLLVRRRVRETPELLAAAAWAVATWLLYAVTSTNQSGVCCSVRWFVPLAAAGGTVLAVLLRECPRYRPDFVVLACGGGAVGALSAWYGAWTPPPRVDYWVLVGVTLAAWGFAVLRRRRRRVGTATVGAPRRAA